jgi:hypothetical protein
MATYVNDLRLKEIATGDESGTWGTSTNTNLELIAEAFSFGTEAITTNADTHTTTIADGSTDPGRSIYLKYTGTLDSACTITIGPNTVSKLWFIENGTSGSQNIIISQGSGANVTIPAGDVKVVYSDGAGSGAAIVDAFASLNVVDLKVEDDLTVTDDLIVNGDIDLAGSIDVDGTANLDVVDIDGALTQDGGAVFNEDSADVDFRVESNGQTHALFVDGGLDNIGIGYSAAHTATNKGLVILTGDGNGGIQLNKEDGSYPSDGETLGSIGWKGADSANSNAAAGASIVGIAAEDFSGSTEATNLAFNTKPTGTGPGSAPTERMRIDSAGAIQIGGTTNAGFVDFDSVSLQLNTQRNPNTGSFVNTAKSHASIALRGADGGSEIRFGTASANNTASTERMRINSNGTVAIGATGGTYILDLLTTGNNGLRVNTGTSSADQLYLGNTGGVSSVGTLTDDNFQVITNGSQRMLFTSSDVTVDAAGDIILDADGGNILFKDGGVGTFLDIQQDSSGPELISRVSDADFKIRGNDGGSTVTAISFDMSEGGLCAIGSHTPTARLDVRGSVNSEHVVITGGSNSGRGLSIQTAASGGQQDAGVVFDAQDTESGGNPYHAFQTAGSEKMRINSDGDVIIGGTSAGAAGALSIQPDEDDNAPVLTINRASTTNTSDPIRFKNGGSTVSQISYNNSTVTYGTGSDARLKNILGEAKGLEIVNKLNPVNFEWKDGGEIQDGLIAQEVEELIPYAVNVNEEGYYSMDYSKVVTPLIKAIQEQQEQINTLQSEINILKGE